MSDTNRATTAIVVAHPDDEALWLSSVLVEAGHLIFCFGAPFARPAKAEARRRAVTALPLAGIVDLALPESGAGFAVDWRDPELTETGVAITDGDASAQYTANYEALLTALRPALTGMRDVYTHNPWGEYGHTEHIQVHRAVVALQAELGFTLWFSNYVGPLSLALARRLAAQPSWQERRAMAPDHALALQLRAHYRRHGAWTWNRWHRWPRQEMLYARPGGGAVLKPLSGETLLDVSGLGPAFWRPSHRRL